MLTIILPITDRTFCIFVVPTMMATRNSDKDILLDYATFRYKPLIQPWNRFITRSLRPSASGRLSRRATCHAKRPDLRSKMLIRESAWIMSRLRRENAGILPGSCRIQLHKPRSHLLGRPVCCPRLQDGPTNRGSPCSLRFCNIVCIKRRGICKGASSAARSRRRCSAGVSACVRVWSVLRSVPCGGLAWLPADNLYTIQVRRRGASSRRGGWCLKFLGGMLPFDDN